MGSSTQHLNLYKPDRTDYVSVITDLNNNFDKIDDFAEDVEGRIPTFAVKFYNYTLTGNVVSIATGLTNKQFIIAIANSQVRKTRAEIASDSFTHDYIDVIRDPAGSGDITGTLAVIVITIPEFSQA